MPTFSYEAMNTSGQEVKDEIEAGTSEEAIAKIRGKGFFPTKVREKAAKKKTSKEGARRSRTGQDAENADFLRRRPAQATRGLHPPAFHPSGCRPAHSPLAPNPRTTAKTGIAQGDRRRRCRGSRSGRQLVRCDGQVPQGLRQTLCEHDQRRRNRRRARPDPRPPCRVHGKSRQAQEEGHRRDDLSGSGHQHRGRRGDDDHDLRHSQVREHLQGLPSRTASADKGAAGNEPLLRRPVWLGLSDRVPFCLFRLHQAAAAQ